MIEDYIRRAVERAIRDAEHPSGMSTHDGKARVEASYLRRMLVMLSAAPTPPAQGDAALDVLRELVEARDAFNAASEALQLQETSLRLRRATVEARALLTKRGAA